MLFAIPIFALIGWAINKTRPEDERWKTSSIWLASIGIALFLFVVQVAAFASNPSAYYGY